MPEPRILHAIGNAHIDPVWLWRWPEGLETIRATFRSALDRMEEYPDFIFTCSSSAFYALLEQSDPGMLAEIRRRVEEGRWELVGGWWVEPDANVPCGESLIRQGLYGQRYLERTFGRRATVGYNPDTFGHPAGLPQILRHVGLDRYVFMRPGPHEKPLGAPVFRWRSADGSEVIAARIARSYCTGPAELKDHVRACARAASPHVADYVVFYGVGNHGGGPTKANIEGALRQDGVEPPFTLRLSRLDRFFESVERGIEAGADLPVVNEELQYHARGCYAAESGIKRENRRVEHLLMAAERLCSVASLETGRPYPDEELREAWRTLLFTQFHDILAGTSLPDAYVDARDAQGYAAHVASRALHGAAQTITAHIDTRGPGSAVVLINTLPWPVRLPIEIERGSASVCDAEGSPIPAQEIEPTTVARQRRSCLVADLPALGYRVIREVQRDGGAPRSDAPLEVTSQTIENAWWRIRIGDASGCIGSLYDRKRDCEVLCAPGMGLVVLDDASDTWSHGVHRFRAEVGRFGAACSVVEEDGPVRAAIRATLQWGSSTIIHRMRLYRDVPVIEGELRINWNEQLHALKLALPTAIGDGVATYETPYGLAHRPCDGCEQPGGSWADLSGWLSRPGSEPLRYGLAVLNDSKYGYDALMGELRLTLLRSPAYAHHDPAELSPDGSYTYTDQGWQTVRYRLAPHVGCVDGAALARQAIELNVPPVAVNEYAHEGPLPAAYSFMEVSPDNVVALVCKRAEDGDDLVIRVHETEGRPTDAAVRLRGGGIAWRCRLRPLELRSWRVSASGAVTEVNGLEDALSV
ncbi:MAG: alpha-mannosidase [Chthonomonadales bacterium]|nr:alpha-mannosidase [Chthonomonadales bacterium]